MRLRPLAFWLVTPAALGLLQPDPARAAGPVPGNPLPLVRDAALTDEGALAGAVVDRQGQPIPGVEVLLLHAGNVVADTITAGDGRFRIARVPGGMYEVSAASGAGIYRVWQHHAAPPNAVGSVVVVGGDDAVRGQSPRTGFFRSDAFLISATVVGAVAIPIVILTARRDQPPGS